ncbi:protocadherin Fat 4 isoform X3 [Agrilus planipennis]|nr:protocadherin Fat 4 isoform X3 [Agrilus planipennis]
MVFKKIKMKKKIILLSLTTLLINCTSIHGATWEFVPNDMDDRVSLNNEGEVPIIYMDEEIKEYITIAYMTYTGPEPPTASFQSPPRGNTTLGLVFVQNSTYNNYWALVVTEKQDYESSMWDTNPRYLFTVAADDYSLSPVLIINNIDDNPPVLETATDTTCSIPENYIGPSNCTFTISDLDGWINYMTYEIVGTFNEENLFAFRLEDESSITNTTYKATLILHTIDELDFETRSIYFFDLIARDSGNNTGRLKIYVEVEDMPDMPPVWTSVFASLQFDEKTEQTYSVNAIDGDIGLNWEINYWLTTSNSEWEGFFEIENKTGVITINPIDRDALDNSIYYFTIFAYEVPDPTWMINQSVTVIVNDVNDNIPVITMSPLSVSIEENKTLSLPINITINDIDTGNNAVYRVQLLDDTNNGYNEAFQIVPNQGYKEWTFYLSVSDSSLLDYENEAWQELTFQVRSLEIQNQSHIDIKTVNVSLINWNDEYPIFESSEYEVTINETLGINEVVAVVFATDRDIGDTVTHSLLGTAMNRVMSIDPETGEIRTTVDRAFDYETSNEVIIQVKAEDSMNDTHHSVVAQLTVTVLDVNDKTPTISVPSTVISVEENQNDGFVISDGITAADPDSTANLVFSIEWDSPTTYATKYGQRVDSQYYLNSVLVETKNISEGPGGYARAVLTVNEIIANNTPDYERFDTLFLTLKVEDLNQEVNDGTATVVFSISIIDLNDNAPIFTNSSITANNSVVENALAGTIIGTITATDADGVNYNVVSYSLRSADDETPDDWVLIDNNTGQLTVKSSNTIDADIPIYYLNYIVEATDGYWITEAEISIFIIDTNDNTPIIQSNLSKPFEIYEKSEDNTSVTLIEVTDADRDSPYNEVYFTLSSENEEVYQLFTFDPLSGLFYVRKRSNYELDRDFGTQSFAIAFTVTDNYFGTGISHAVNSNFQVNLLDINDQIPKITNTSVTTSENVLKGDCIGNLIAYDYDEEGTDNTKIAFTIMDISKRSDAISNPPEDMFTVTTDENFETQIASVCTNYDLKGHFGTYEVLIQTHDFGTFPSAQYYNQTLDFLIEKYNFEAPTIIYPQNRSIIYLSKTQTSYAQLYLYNRETLDPFSATDNQGEKWDIQFSIVKEQTSSGEETSFFAFQQTAVSNARLVLTSTPDYNSEYELSIMANCNCSGDEPFTSNININIRFHDLSAEPIFSQSTQNLSFYENTTGLNTTEIIAPAYWNADGNAWDEFPIYYLIETDSTGDCFVLDSVTRELTLVKMLDREEIDSHTLTVQASQSSKGTASPSPSARLTIFIEVLDVNDNPPHFNSSRYFGGVTTSTTIGSRILTLEAYDLDIDVLTFSIDEESLEISDSSLRGINNPFIVNGTTGDITLNFQVLASMLGHFTFQAIVTDLANHTDETSVKIYIASESNRVRFTFEASQSTVRARYSTIISVLEDILHYVANIESIQPSTDNSGNTLTDQTDVITHFIDEENNEVVDASTIQSYVIINKTNICFPNKY